MRTVNSFTLRVLSMLNKKATVKDISVQQMFEMFAQKPLIENEDASFARTYSSKSGSNGIRFTMNRICSGCTWLCRRSWLI